MRRLFEGLRNKASWLLFATGLVASFLVYGFIRAQFSFADCDGRKPNVDLGGVVAAGFGITSCMARASEAPTTATAAPVADSSAAPRMT